MAFTAGGSRSAPTSTCFRFTVAAHSAASAATCARSGCDDAGAENAEWRGALTVSFFAVENLGVRFGGVVAVDSVSFQVEQGEVYTIIGPNGAGKTTIFNLIGLIYPQTSGHITFEGQEVTGAPHHVAQRGIARTFQNIELFEHATVLQDRKSTRLNSSHMSISYAVF